MHVSFVCHLQHATRGHVNGASERILESAPEGGIHDKNDHIAHATKKVILSRRDRVRKRTHHIATGVEQAGFRRANAFFCGDLNYGVLGAARTMVHQHPLRSVWCGLDIFDVIKGRDRAGIISAAEYLGGLSGVVAGYESQPGRLKQSAEVSSFDTWIEQYRPDEHSINTAMSYYTKGELLGLVFDLEIRSRTKGARSLDDVMRKLMENHGLPKPGFTDAQLKATFE
ncbi:MAG: hypothetical protein ACK5R3_00795, partial [Armatimonadota bacterium]